MLQKNQTSRKMTTKKIDATAIVENRETYKILTLDLTGLPDPSDLSAVSDIIKSFADAYIRNYLTLFEASPQALASKTDLSTNTIKNMMYNHDVNTSLATITRILSFLVSSGCPAPDNRFITLHKADNLLENTGPVSDCSLSGNCEDCALYLFSKKQLQELPILLAGSLPCNRIRKK